MGLDTHTHPFNGSLSGTTRVSRYQKGKPIWILLKQETERDEDMGLDLSGNGSSETMYDKGDQNLAVG